MPSRALLALVVLLACAPSAVAADGPLGLDCAPIDGGLTQCTGLVPTFDGVPLDTTLTLPAGAPGPKPLIAELHGLGNSKHEYLDPASRAYTDNAFGWAREGYAVLTHTARGFWGSCGTPESRAASPAACARGNLHLADVRFEGRDTQELIGRLVDAGVADPARIGVTGDSYGGGQSMMLAALSDRVMLPDGKLVPWRSPNGTALRLAAAAPVIPWTDLVSAIAPNGRSRSVGVTPDAELHAPVGVFKTSVANAIFAATTTAIGPGQPVGEPFVPGRPMGFLAPPGSDPQADVAGWVARADAGEPYDDPYIEDVIDQLTRFHSAYGIDPSSPPPPLLIGSGFTDDIFPVDEVLRFTERMRRDHPKVPLSLLLMDFGHQRAANKPADRDRLVRDIHTWMDHHVRGLGQTPATGVVALTQTCPRERPSEGPFTAPTFAGLSRGEAALVGMGAQTVRSGTGDPAVAAAIDPAGGMGDGCAQTATTRADGTAVYELPASSDGLLLLGAPSIRARVTTTGLAPQLAARLWDVAPGGATQRLVARGLLRPTGAAEERWELHPAAWRFEPGHTVKLELLGNDAPYGRPSNGAFTVTLDALRLTLPTRAAGASTTTVAPVRCASRRRFVIRLPRGLRGLRVTVGGRKVRVRAGRRRTAVVDLRGRPRGVVAVRISGRTKGGRRIVQVRRYRPCTR